MINLKELRPAVPANFANPVRERTSPEKALERPITRIKEMGKEHLPENDKERMSREEFKEILKVATQVIFGNDSHFEFRLHEKTGTMMCKLIDTETNEVIREIPSEKILDMVAGIWELVGIIVDEKA